MIRDSWSLIAPGHTERLRASLARRCRPMAVCVSLLLLACAPAMATRFQWTDDDWSGGRYQSAVSVDPEVHPGLLVLQDDLTDIRYLASPAAWQGIYCLAVYHDTLFLAASHYPFQYEGAEVLTYDYLTGAFASAYRPDQEGILILKVFGDTLWSANPDPVVPYTHGGPHLYDGQRWVYKATIDSVYHVCDVQMLNGILFATTGNSDGSGRCYISRDRGDTFTEALRIRRSPQATWRCLWGAGQHDGRVFIQPDGYDPEGRVVYTSADGVDWDTLNVPGMPIDKQATFVAWGDSLLMAMNNKLLIWDDHAWTWHYLPFSGYRWCRGYHVRAGDLYGGGNSCKIYRWLGGADWEHVADMCLDPASEEIESIVTYYGRLYISTSRADTSQTARLYAAAVAPWGQLLSQVHDFERLVEHGVLSWEAFEPSPLANVRFQIRSAHRPDEILLEPFVGPDGTGTSYYTDPGTPLPALHDGDRCFQYAVTMTCPDRMRPALLYSVTLTADTLSTPSALDGTPATPTQELDLRMLTAQPVIAGDGVVFQMTREGPQQATGNVAGALRIRIVDLDGRVIRSERASFTNGPVALWRWDLRDGTGQLVPSGIYSALFEGTGLPTRRTARSMVVLK